MKLVISISYAVETIDDVIEILSQTDAASFHRRVKGRLEDFFRNAQKSMRQR